MLTVVNGILGALVGVTGGCAVFNVYSSLIVGAVGSFVANITPPLLDYWKVEWKSSKIFVQTPRILVAELACKVAMCRWMTRWARPACTASGACGA